MVRGRFSPNQMRNGRARDKPPELCEHHFRVWTQQQIYDSLKVVGLHTSDFPTGGGEVAVKITARCGVSFF